MERQFLIPVSLAQAIADYLAGRPYREVAGFIAGLSQLQSALDPDEQMPAAFNSGSKKDASHGAD
jgi:hypothetical protein